VTTTPRPQQRFLGGSVAWSLYRAARRSGRGAARDVVLAADEIGLAGAFLTGALVTIQKIARNFNLRLLLATQYAGALEDAVLRDFLFNQTGARAFFALDARDAREAAAFLPGGRSLPSRVEVKPDREARGGFAPRTERFALEDGWGEPVVASRSRWAAVARRLEPGSDLCGMRDALAALGCRRAYVRDPATGRAKELFKTVAPLAPGAWRLEGPGGVRLAVTFPLPRLSALPGEPEDSGWVRRLTALPRRRAFLFEPDRGGPVETDIDDVPVLEPDPDYLAQVLAKGRTADQADAEYLARQDAIAAAEAAAPPPEPKGKGAAKGKGAPAAAMTVVASPPDLAADVAAAAAASTAGPGILPFGYED
jgi:hypothetical protein